MRNLWNTLLDRWRFRRQARDPDADFVVHRRRKGRRAFSFPEERGRRRIALRIGLCVCAAICLLSAIHVIFYAADYVEAKQASAALRDAYHAPEPSATEAPEVTATPSATRPATETPIPTLAPLTLFAENEPARLQAVRYPLNAMNIVSTRFEKLRRQNGDIVAWLTIEDLLDEAVVQRDNEYYLDRDYRGYHNVNGAIFLEQACDLSTRPYTYLVYGHNMKSGLMFGSLRNYEDITFYRNNPFITFDTLYEEGRYVIFAVATVSTDVNDRSFFNFTSLCSPLIDERRSALTTLINRSRYVTTIDVQPEDQLLLLVTCASDDADRRVIAARRIREGETEEALQQTVKRTKIR